MQTSRKYNFPYVGCFCIFNSAHVREVLQKLNSFTITVWQKDVNLKMGFTTSFPSLEDDFKTLIHPNIFTAHCNSHSVCSSDPTLVITVMAESVTLMLFTVYRTTFWLWTWGSLYSFSIYIAFLSVGIIFWCVFPYLVSRRKLFPLEFIRLV